MDELQKVMLRYRDEDGITFFYLIANGHIRLGAKAMLGNGYHLWTATWSLADDPITDPHLQILGELVFVADDIREARRRSS